MAGPGRSLRVLERDGFFDDAFFREAWDDFDRAMQSVLDRFDSTGLKVDVGSRNQCRDVYSKIRSSKIDEDLYASQALQITEKDGKFQVVMDVKDFNPRELQVRAVDDRIVVEGSYQKVSEDGVSSSCKSFYKEFTLPPAADLDQVTTALSRDGVLTIRAPRKEGAAITDTTPRAPISSSTSSSTSSTQQQQFGDNSSTSSFKSTSSRRVIQSSSSFDSDGFDSLPKEMREKLMFCDSGFGSTKTSTCSSPAPSEAGSESSRVSSTMEFDLSKRAPVKTEVAFNVSKPSQGPPPQQAPPQQAHPPQSPPSYPQSPPPQPQPTHQYPSQQFQQFQQHPGPQYQSQGPAQYAQSPPPQAQYAQSPPPQYQSPPPQAQYQSPPPQFQSQPPQYQSPPPQFQSPPPQFPQSPTQQAQFQSPQPQFHPQQTQFSQYQAPQQYTPQHPVSQSMPATGSGNQTSVSVTEENGRRVVTSQTSNVVQEKDGFKEHRETAAEITDKDSQAARREASTKLSKVEEDPEGKFKRAESTDAAEVSESCIQHLPDGSVMSVKKNSTSSSTSFKQSFSSGITGGDIMGGFFPQPPLPSNFPQGFDDFRNLMGRGPSLMSQMSTDSMGSTLSGRSGFTDMSNFSNFTDASSPFSDMSFGNMSNFSTRSKNFQQQQTQQQQQPPQQSQQPQQQEFGSPRSRKGFSTSSSSSTSSFSQSFSSNFGDGNF